MASPMDSNKRFDAGGRDSDILKQMYDRCVSNHARRAIEKLSKPMDEIEASACVQLFKDIKVTGKLNEKARSYLEAKGVSIPNELLTYVGFLFGKVIPLFSPEITVEDIDVGTVIYYQEQHADDYSKLPEDLRPTVRPPQVLAYFDAFDQKMYMSPAEEFMQKGWFGSMYASVLAHGMHSVNKEKEEQLAASQATDPTLTDEERKEMIASSEIPLWQTVLNERKFIQLEDDDRNLLTFVNWCILYGEKDRFEMCEKVEDVQFQLMMRKNFGNQLGADQKEGDTNV